MAKHLKQYWKTKEWVQCRNEKPFEAQITLRSGDAPSITCPTCARIYTFNENGEWMADRPLVILGDGKNTPMLTPAPEPVPFSG